MTVKDLKNLKKSSGLTNEEIAQMSGIPYSTVNKIFSGATKNPRYATLLAIEEVLVMQEKIPFTYNKVYQEPMLLREAGATYGYAARTYTGEDIQKLSSHTRAELIDGKLYMMAGASRTHQFLVAELLFEIKAYIRAKQGGCQAYTAPFDVRLFRDDSVIVQPDIMVICNTDILTEKGCMGAPDWIIEIVSQSNSSHDYITKLMQYMKAGVREYWIVNSDQQKVIVMNFEGAKESDEYSFDDTIPSGVIEGFEVQIGRLFDLNEFFY